MTDSLSFCQGHVSQNLTWNTWDDWRTPVLLCHGHIAVKHNSLGLWELVPRHTCLSGSKNIFWQHVKTPTEIKMRRSPKSSELIYGCVWNLAPVQWQSTEYLHTNGISLLVNGGAAKTCVWQEVCGFCGHHLPDSHTQQNNSRWHKVDPHTWIKLD